MEAVLRRPVEAPLLEVHCQVLPEEGGELVDELLRHPLALPAHHQLGALLAADPVVAAVGIAEGDGSGCSACCCCGGGGGEEGEEGGEAPCGAGGGFPRLGEGLGGEWEAEGGEWEERAAGPAEAEEGGRHGW